MRPIADDNTECREKTPPRAAREGERNQPRSEEWIAGSSPAMTTSLDQKKTVMPGLDPGIHVREPN
jgi:hypothetical protein